MNSIRYLLPWLCLVIVIVGTLLKFKHLESKLFWQDEISTVLYTSGVTPDKYINAIPINQIKDISYYDSLLHLNNKSQSLKSEIKGILSDTHLTPAHYVFLTLWHRIVGDDDLHFRLFSVFIFIISLPFLFLLARTLFNSNLGGWIATSLYAVSPFINLAAQEARYYGLWVFCFILSKLFIFAGYKAK